MKSVNEMPRSQRAKQTDPSKAIGPEARVGHKAQKLLERKHKKKDWDQGGPSEHKKKVSAHDNDH